MISRLSWAILGVALASPGFAQTFGEINGVVYDSTGSVIAGAEITAINPQTNFTRTATRLNVGSLTETVEVRGGAPLLNTENAADGVAKSPVMIHNVNSTILNLCMANC